MSIWKTFTSKINDLNQNYDEHMITLLTILWGASLLVSFISDIIISENIAEIATSFALIFVIPALSYFGVSNGKMHVIARILILIQIFVFLPICFFFGGGVNGGVVSWIIFSYLYIAVALNGYWRIVTAVILSFLTLLEFEIGYYSPELVTGHTTGRSYIDILLSTLTVSIAICITAYYQRRILNEDNQRILDRLEKAQEQNLTQNRFFSSMSHEIRTPINSILGLNEIILRQEDASDEILRDAANIQGAGKMLLALVNDILDISKIEAGKMDIVPVNYKVGELISEIVNMLWMRAEQKGLELSVDVDPTIPTELYGDEVRIKQILINLLNNAVKYTREGKVSLYMECGEKQDGRVQLSFIISDTGIGIKQEAIPFLFDAFQRVDEKKNRMIEGTGLGLSIVKQLVALMDGNITVNSVYMQGSTFTVTLWQDITNREEVGDINITNYGSIHEKKEYHSEFTAPTAKVLIVDDNEMNLEVEKKLLADTEMTVDTVLSGKEALTMTLKKHYDVILMDHLMPEMDGIECLMQIRKQIGGLNTMVPIIVLTANAGGENKKLYDTAGFDGYLIKPVSGKQLEGMLLSHLPQSKISRLESDDLFKDEMNTARGYIRKASVLITTSTMCDLPTSLIKELGIGIIPFNIHTDGKTFWDNVEAGTDELVRYIKEDEKQLDSEPPKVEEFENFFAKSLKQAHHVIHIAITTGMSEEYERAQEAAKAFDNVTVINSESLSSSTGILILIAHKLAKQNIPLDDLIAELNEAKKRINCSFIIGDNYYLMRRGFIKNNLYMVMKNLELRPSLRITDDKFGVGGIYFGEKRKCYGKYIKKILPKKASYDDDIAFITYVDIQEEDLLWIEEQVRSRASFKHIIFQKASAAISLNCGPGSFGILFMSKGKNSYHIGSMLTAESLEFELEDEEELTVVEETITGNSAAILEEENSKDGFLTAEGASETAEEERINEGAEIIPGIDLKTAIMNSGSKESFKTVLKIFYESIAVKAQDIEKYYEEKDFDNYIIKVHALKSSARLIGAVELGNEAEKLELAGKQKNTEYIDQHHAATMDSYRAYKDILAEYFGEEQSGDSDETKPVADESIIESVYEMLKEAAESMDVGTIEDTFAEMEDYKIPEPHASKLNSIKEKADQLDYEGMLSILDQ